MKTYSRREATKILGCLSVASLGLPLLSSFNNYAMALRKIPSSGEELPVVGLGTWQSFDVGGNTQDRARLKEVLSAMKSKGGKLIDSSPMYGSSERVVGDLTAELGIQGSFFYATKVWTRGKEAGIRQMQASMQKMQRKEMDLMQIHNLVDLNTHIRTLKSWKEEGKIRYWGITHYTDSSHEELSRIIKRERPDFAQFNYSITNRNAEKNLLPVARESGTAVIINRPYSGGSLFRLTRGKELPGWCSEIDVNSWGQFFLKYLLGEKAVTCVIPGTSKPHHLLDNMAAGYGKLPDQATRRKMISFLEGL